MTWEIQTDQKGGRRPGDPNDPTFYGNVYYNGELMSDDMARQRYAADQAAAQQPSGGGGGPSMPQVGEGSGDRNSKWNGGSPPAVPLGEDMGWTWNGNDWVQTKGSGLGWNPPGGGGGGSTYRPSGGGGGGGGFQSSMPDFGQGNYGDAPDFNAPRWQAPPEFSYAKKFEAPDEAALQKDPGFQFRLDQGRKALEASAAGKGILRTGGTLKDLVNYGQNFATNEYANVYNRGFNEYKFDYDKEADIYARNYNLKRDVFDRNYKAAYDEYAPKLTGWQVNTNNKARAQEALFNREWQMYNADRDRDLQIRRIEQGDVT